MKARFSLAMLLTTLAVAGAGPAFAWQQLHQCGQRDDLFERVVVSAFLPDLEAMGYKFERDAGDCWLHVSTHFFASEDGRPTLTTHFSLLMENGYEMQMPEMVEKNSAKLTALSKNAEDIFSRLACVPLERKYGKMLVDDPAGFIKAGGTLSYSFDLRSDPFQRRNGPFGSVFFDKETQSQDTKSSLMLGPTQPLGHVEINSCEDK